MVRAPRRWAASAVFVASTSTTESWKPAAISAARASGTAAPSSAVPPTSAITMRRTAALRPLKLESRLSPRQARGGGGRGAAADDEGHGREVWRLGLLAGIEQPAGVDVALQVVHGHEGPVVEEGERLGHGQPDQQRAGEPGPEGHGDGVDVAGVVQPGTCDRLVEDRAR